MAVLHAALPVLERDGARGMCGLLLMDSSLGRGRLTMVSWLVEAGAPAKGRSAGGADAPMQVHAAQFRAKAIKLLGKAIDVDVQVGALNRRLAQSSLNPIL